MDLALLVPGLFLAGFVIFGALSLRDAPWNTRLMKLAGRRPKRPR